MTAPTRREFRVSSLFEPISHYTDAVALGDLLFVSGCAATDESGGIVGGDDAAAQARQALSNLVSVLEAAGSSIREVLKMTVYLTDINDREKINPVRQEFFGDVRPASTLIEISRLAIPGARVEIELIARIPDGTA
jgi:reactive intermediate/imine deaminase